MYVDRDTFLRAVPDAGHRIARLAELYRKEWGTDPTHVASGPGRTEIIGNHTDHNRGQVVAAAIQLDAVAVAGPSPDNTLRLRSDGWEETFSVAVDAPAGSVTDAHDTARLMAGVADGMRKLDLPAPAYQAVIDSRVTPGSGLSSSAAFEVALAGVHLALAGQETVDPVLVARAGQHAENHFMGKPSGLMDQMASAVGSAVAIDFHDGERPQYHQLPLDFRANDFRLVVVNTGGSHANLTPQYAAVPEEMHSVAAALGVSVLRKTSRRELLARLDELREACGDRAVLRAMHFFDEQERVAALVDAVDQRHHEQVMRLMQESGTSSWTLLQNVIATGATREQSLALALEITRNYLSARGAQGACRVHGGGFAGTILAVVPESLAEEYHTVMNRAFGHGSVTELQIRPEGLLYARR